MLTQKSREALEDKLAHMLKEGEYPLSILGVPSVLIADSLERIAASAEAGRLKLEITPHDDPLSTDF